GTSVDQRAPAVSAKNTESGAEGFLAGTDPVFHNRVGAYGQSDTVGVMGLATADSATGVYGVGGSFVGAPGAGSIGVRGETFTGTGVHGQSFGNGFAGRFIGNVDIEGGSLTMNGGGSLTMNGGGSLTINGGGDVTLADCAEDFELVPDLPE